MNDAGSVKYLTLLWQHSGFKLSHWCFQLENLTNKKTRVESGAGFSSLFESMRTFHEPL